MVRDRTIFHSVVVLAAMNLLIAGCSGPNGQGTGSPEGRTQAANLVRDREVEMAAIRADMAASKITTAKKEAELQELRALVTQLRQENVEARQALLEMRQTAETHQMEVVALRNEQEHVVQAKQDQQLTGLKDMMIALTHEMELLRLGITRVPEKPASTKLPKPNTAKQPRPNQPEPRSISPNLLIPSKGPAPDAPTIQPAMQVVKDEAMASEMRHVTVQRGDTLRTLARRYSTTVTALREINGMEEEALTVGQAIKIPLATPLRAVAIP